VGGTTKDTAHMLMPLSRRSGRFPALPRSAALRAGSILPDGSGIIPIHAVALKR